MDSPPNRHVPKPWIEHKPRSLLAEHKYLALAFLLVIIAVLVYVFGAPRAPAKIAPPPAPVYVEPLDPRSTRP
ncbi:MAG TPA: hypothetical protein VKH13_07920 [Steroidobacteraceae bacterium]|nr:hypothetical protein [Steroidobacteraceae bacterium]